MQDVEITEEELEQLAEFFTLLLAQIDSDTNHAVAYKVIYSLMSSGNITQTRMTRAAKIIKGARLSPGQDRKMH